jgi:hypothetical protein
MFLHIAALDKPFAAHLTLIRLLAGMDAPMPLQADAQPKRLGAKLALIVPLAGVDHPMIAEKLFPPERTRAQIAPERQRL